MNRENMLKCLGLVLLLLFPAEVGWAETWHVNNQTGDDRNGGGTPETAFATIAKAVSSSRTSDRIVLARTGVVYRESIVMERKGGTPGRPFVVEGNGAVITGLRIIKAAEWKKVSDGLFLLSVKKKPYAFPYLADHGKRLPEKGRGELGAGEYYWDAKEGIYFKCADGRTPASYELSATLVDECGFAVRDASYIICRNLISECVANDGFSLHGDCRGIQLENVESRFNGNQGISIHETCEIFVRGAHLHHNMQGIVDVNAARSFYNGVLAELNDYGAVFIGGFHSLVDCVFRDNDTQIAIEVSAPKHLIGSEFNPICRAGLYMKNVIVTGKSTWGLRIKQGTHAVVENSVFSGCQVGVAIEAGAVGHLTTSIISDCVHAISSESSEFFRDYNLYNIQKMRWKDNEYTSGDWDGFRRTAGQEQHSEMKSFKLEVDKDGRVRVEPETLLKTSRKAGPTQHYGGLPRE